MWSSTAHFFKLSKRDTTLRKKYRDRSRAEQGKAEVEGHNYTFFMESISIEYTIERNCNLIHSKGHRIVPAENSTRKREYRTKLCETILCLQESGMLKILKNHWWKEKRGDGACDIDDS